VFEVTLTYDSHRAAISAPKRGTYTPNTLGNFEFDVTLSYRRLERPRRAATGA
jgi:hypothetical protein